MARSVLTRLFITLVFLACVNDAWSKVRSVQMQQRAMDAWSAMLMTPEEVKASGLGPIKCGTWAISVIRDSWVELPQSFKDKYERQQSLAKAAMVQAERTYSSPASGGRFVIYYQTTGSDAVPDSDIVTLTAAGLVPGADGVPDYVQWVAHAFDVSCGYIVDSLHYVYPVAHAWAWMRDLGDYYGFARSQDSIDLDNDLGFFKPWEVDIQGRYDVTVAHEFFHMVQFSYTTSFNFFNEASAVWMEDKVYPDVNDYLQYLEKDVNIMNTPGTPLDAAFDDYDRVVWPMFLDQSYSADVIRFAWENYRAGDMNTVSVFGAALNTFQPGLTFSRSFAEFGRWLYFTGVRSAYCSTFTDAKLWPAVSTDVVPFRSFIFQDRFALQPLSVNYYELQGRGTSIPGLWMTGPDSISVLTTRFTTVPRQLLLDSLCLSAARLFPFPLNGAATGVEAFALFNFNQNLNSGRFATFDSIMTFVKGDTLPFCIAQGFNGRILIEDTLRLLLKDSTGQQDSAAWYLLLAIHGAGFHVEPGSALPGLPGSLKKRKSDIYTLGVHPLIDSLMDAGKLSLQFTVADSVQYYVNYTVSACHPVSGAPFVLDRDSAGWRLDYGAIRAGLPRVGMDSLNGALCRVFYWAVAKAHLTTAAFPNPAYSDDGRLYFTCDSLSSTTPQCRLYTLSGKLVKTLRADRPGERAAPRNAWGKIVFAWDLRNGSGGRVAPGVYLFQIEKQDEYIPITGKVAVVGKKREE